MTSAQAARSSAWPTTCSSSYRQALGLVAMPTGVAADTNSCT
ncbi:hypothetical protein [Kribbella antibiotica]|nr:hypothetical protein [Kribbella antibiotica]